MSSNPKRDVITYLDLIDGKKHGKSITVEDGFLFEGRLYMTVNVDKKKHFFASEPIVDMTKQVFP
jgi:cytoskeletal protein CcmA (bactofilin family)